MYYYKKYFFLKTESLYLKHIFVNLCPEGKIYKNKAVKK